MAKKGKITASEIMDKKVFDLGQKLADSLQPVNVALKEIRESALSYAQLEKDFRIAPDREKFIKIKEKELKLRKDTANTIKAEENSLISIEKKKQELITTEKKALDLENKKIATQKKKITLTVKENEELKILNRNAREAAKLSSKLSTQYEKQSLRLIQLRRAYKDVALSEGETSAKARQLQKDILKLDSALKRVDANVGQFQRSVGNYGIAMKSAGRAVRSMLSAMGLVGGAFLFIQVMRDASRRVVQFDKALQNLAGILGVDRSELKGLEQEIINVASSSIKTSNEVAKLAETLIVLGKTQSEVKKLLKPVNDLSIGLEATSQEAGEFLVQTLNAFGQSAEKGEEFADVMAKIRTSTALDFQRMRDAFSFLAPVANTLNLSLSQTGAIIGVLSDNGIKAQRAGRLMSSAFIKLATAGLTLEDGLDQLNEAQDRNSSELEILEIAYKLFGKQAAALGIVLANNRDKMDDYTESFNNAGGALDTLVNEQLKSLDAHIKILDSTWEKFILGVEDGTGSISNFFKKTTIGLTEIINQLDILNQTQEGAFNAAELDGYSDKLKNAKEDFELFKKVSIGAEEVTFIQKLNVDLEDLNGTANQRLVVQQRLKQIEIDLAETFISNDKKKLLEARKTQAILDIGKLKSKEGEIRAIKELIKLEEERLLAATGEGGKTGKPPTPEEIAASQKRAANDAFALKKFQIQQEIKLQNELANNQDLNAVDRIDAIKRVNDLEIELSKTTHDLLIAQEGLSKDAKLLIQEQYTAELLDIEQDRQDGVENVLKDSLTKAKQRIADERALEDDLFNAKVTALQESLKADEITVEEYEKRLLKLKQEYATRHIQVRIDQLQKELDAMLPFYAGYEELEQKLHDLKILLSDAETENYVGNLDSKLEKEKAVRKFLNEQVAFASNNIAKALNLDAGNINALFSSITDNVDTVTGKIEFNLKDAFNTAGAAVAVAGDISNAVFEKNIANIDEEIRVNDDKYALLIAAAGEDQVQQDLLILQAEEKRQALEKKKRKEQTKQAKYNKAIAFNQAGIGIALAIVSALALFPPPLGIAMAIIVGALGAIQLAAIAASPIPKYRKGTEFHKGGWAEVAEQRPEVISEPNKAPYIQKKRAFLNLPRGTKVTRSVEDYNDLMRASIMTSVDINNNKIKGHQATQVFNSNYDEMIDEMRLTREAIKKNKTNIVIQKQKAVDFNYELFKAKNIDWDL